jgi:hypothetical protein
VKIQEIRNGLAAMYYYQSPNVDKGKSFEDIDADSKRPYLELAESALVGLDKLNLRVAPKAEVPVGRAEAILRDRIEAEVRDFFDGLKVFKKGAIPQEELVARIWGVWKNL